MSFTIMYLGPIVRYLDTLQPVATGNFVFCTWICTVKNSEKKESLQNGTNLFTLKRAFQFPDKQLIKPTIMFKSHLPE
jgi:hypothetical protein